MITINTRLLLNELLEYMMDNNLLDRDSYREAYSELHYEELAKIIQERT